MSQEEADSIIEVINLRAQEMRELIITIGSILALLLPAVEMVGLLDVTPYGQGDDEWIGDDDWEWGDDFTCGDGSTIQASLVNDGYKNCRDGSDEPPEPEPEPVQNNTTVILPPSGCTDPDAANYDPDAEEDDGSCEYHGEEPIQGCTDPDAENYDEWAEEDDGSCVYEPVVESDCRPQMYDAYYDLEFVEEGDEESDYNESANMTMTWDADLTCDEAHNLTVIWTFYDNATDEWAGIQEELIYITYGMDWDYVNLTISAVPAGTYDIYSTFYLDVTDTYYIGTDWLGVEV